MMQYYVILFYKGHVARIIDCPNNEEMGRIWGEHRNALESKEKHWQIQELYDDVMFFKQSEI